MICPFCLHKKTDIYNSRSTNKGSTVWRRRRCLQCQNVFTTQESFNPSDIWKVNNVNKKAPYSRARLAISLIKACDHRQDAESKVWYLFEGIEQQLLPIAARNNQLITTSDIAKVAADILKNFDATAYVKYISHHQPIMDARMLRKHLRDKR